MTRLGSYDGSRESLEGLLSLAADKPPRDWVDRHIDAALLELFQFARRFREAEAFVSIQGRKARSEAIAVVIGAGSDTRTISRILLRADHTAGPQPSRAGCIEFRGGPRALQRGRGTSRHSSLRPAGWRVGLRREIWLAKFAETPNERDQEQSAHRLGL